MQFIDLQAQYRALQVRIDKRIHAVLEHGQYIMGPEVSELEERLADYVGVKHVITCANGTDALQLALIALGIGKGDAVLCPTFTFFASAEAISFVGATPIFVDVDEATFNICPHDLEQKIKSVQSENLLNLKAIMAVDLFGLPANYPALEVLAKQYDLKIIEDGAQGFGGAIDGQKVGSFGDIATTSFFPAKPLGCYGDGGAVFTNNDGLANLLKSYRIHGKGQDKYDNVRIGMNSRLDTLQAAILLEKLSVFPDELVRRQTLADYYHSHLNGLVAVPLVPNLYQSAWAQYTLRLTSSNLANEINRDGVIAQLKAHGVPAVVYYGKCMHEQTAYSKQKQYGGLSVAKKLSQQVVSIPMHPYMLNQDQEKIIESLKLALVES